MANRDRRLPLGTSGKTASHRAVKIVGTIAEKAAAEGLPFLVIGGNAVIAYGYPRMTSDLDLLVRKADRRAWDTLIMQLDFRQHQIAHAFHMYNPKVSGQIPVDLILVDDSTFEKLARSAVESDMEGTTIRIPSLAHLIAMKLHSIKSGAEHRHSRDLSDVATLVQLNKVDLASPEYAEIVERYATPAILATVRLLVDGPRSPGA